MTKEELEEWIVQRVARELSVPPDHIDVSIPLAGLGLDSAQAVALTGELEDLLKRRISPTVVYEHPTISRLAAHLAAVEEPEPGR
ncbi:MAG: acyl carrier protein [Candidatus Riflebacteria bacterium]|nr:acyl carrier protein [Candidatus Riflebacteria bacterium]